jgi:cytochrome c oxidase accessory protein FixG
MAKKHHLHSSRLASTDETGKRVYFYPEDVKGFWTQFRKYFFFFLIAIYLIVPWIYVGGEQIVLLDLVGRKFRFFGLEFMAHDSPVLIFPLLAFAFFVGGITAIYGRLWCGFACPQTVFIDGIYRRIERLIEGNARKRAKLDKEGLGPEKIFKKGLKWGLFFLVSTHIAHSLVGYFVGTHNLVTITSQNPNHHFSLFMLTMSLTALFLVDFGFFREQFCTIVCPYGRMQGVLTDDNTKVISYDMNRGGILDSEFTVNNENGDCINCYRCVKACPTGIDIRRGNQLECIACTQCIDACDEIMTKLKKPKGLIRFASLNELKGIAISKTGIRKFLYFTISMSLIVAFIVTLTMRSSLNLSLIRQTGKPYEIVKENDIEYIVNRYQLKTHSVASESIKLKISASGETQIIMAQNPITIKPGNNSFPLYIKNKKALYEMGRLELKLTLMKQELGAKNKFTHFKDIEVSNVGPF